jgi:hypothetical protein
MLAMRGINGIAELGKKRYPRQRCLVFDKTHVSNVRPGFHTSYFTGSCHSIPAILFVVQALQVQAKAFTQNSAINTAIAFHVSVH